MRMKQYWLITVARRGEIIGSDATDKHPGDYAATLRFDECIVWAIEITEEQYRKYEGRD